MNVDEIRKELEYQAALARFGDLDIKRVQKLFDLLMNHGIYYDEFIEIEYPRSTELKDFIPHFEVALKQIDIIIPQNKNPAALWFIIRRHMENIVKKISDPVKELLSLMGYIEWDCCEMS